MTPNFEDSVTKLASGLFANAGEDTFTMALAGLMQALLANGACYANLDRTMQDILQNWCTEEKFDGFKKRFLEGDTKFFTDGMGGAERSVLLVLPFDDTASIAFIWIQSSEDPKSFSGVPFLIEEDGVKPGPVFLTRDKIQTIDTLSWKFHTVDTTLNEDDEHTNYKLYAFAFIALAAYLEEQLHLDPTGVLGDGVCCMGGLLLAEPADAA
jgi:hypothetical protein